MQNFILDSMLFQVAFKTQRGKKKKENWKGE